MAIRLLVFGLLAPVVAAAQTLDNGRIRAVFDRRGLTSLTDETTRRQFRVARDGFAVTIDGVTVSERMLGPPIRTRERNGISYRWSGSALTVEARYRLEPGWRFLSKQILVTKPSGEFVVDSVTALDIDLREEPSSWYRPKSPYPSPRADYGAALRFADGNGLLAVVQNPFLDAKLDLNRVTLRYAPGMKWRSSDGAYPADRALLAPYRLTGRIEPAAMVPEWTRPSASPEPGLDEAEVTAFTDLVRAFVLEIPTKPLNLFVGWCANDYQIDVGTEEGRTEYRRLFDRAKEVGADYVLFAPSNSELSRREESLDDWSWEHVLWLGLGQQIRRGSFDWKTEPMPASIGSMVDYAKGKGLGLLAYVYPVVPFAANPNWLVPHRRDPKRKLANLANRDLQDWLIDALVTFHHRSGIKGYAFDHAFLDLEGATVYAQWWGWRRVMEELRRRVPGIVIDGRQAYHRFGPWSWLAGSYPHPTENDEQPESFVPFPDLHFDRVSANRERFTAYHYRHYEFTPSELVPGYTTHQTSRGADDGEMPATTGPRGIQLTRFRARDWDYLGWRYSVLSSIAVGGWNNVINMIPARDSAEFEHFSTEDARWFRGWIEWTESHKEFLRHTRTILGQPAMGKVDGTASFIGDRGFLFLFNPNGRPMKARVPLDAQLGMVATGPLAVEELYPRSGTLRGRPASGWWRAGDTLTVELAGGSAVVLGVGPAPRVDKPVLFNAAGSADVVVGVVSTELHLDHVKGEPGTEVELLVALPSGVHVKAARVNGAAATMTTLAPGRVGVRVRFAGARFSGYQPIVVPDSGYRGGALEASIRIPKRIFDQLARRRSAWPIPWTAEDYRTTWLVPERLLLFVQIAEPNPNWEARLLIDGKPVQLRKAYTAVRAAKETFVGFYADLSELEPEREYRVGLDLPQLAPGQLQGVFFENVESELTEAILP